MYLLLTINGKAALKIPFNHYSLPHEANKSTEYNTRLKKEHLIKEYDLQSIGRWTIELVVESKLNHMQFTHTDKPIKTSSITQSQRRTAL